MHVKGGVEDLFDRVLPARSWEMPEEHELPAKVGRCNEKLLVHNFDRRAKLWPANFFQHLPIFAGNSHFTGISQLRAGKTRSKRPRSHWLSTVHLLPYMWASFYPLDTSRYLSSFLSWRLKSKKFPFFTNSHFNLVNKFVGLLRTQFWCHRPSQ